MNTVVFEIEISKKNEKKFLEWNKANNGPSFIEMEKSAEYFKNDEEFAPYYAKDFGRKSIFRIVIPVCAEITFCNHIDNAVKELKIHLKYICFYQDPGTGESSGYWMIY